MQSGLVIYRSALTMPLRYDKACIARNQNRRDPVLWRAEPCGWTCTGRTLALVAGSSRAEQRAGVFERGGAYQERFRAGRCASR
jgi:hypothetical protein